MLRTRSVNPTQIGPCGLERLCQCAIIDQRGADRLDPAGLGERIRAHQHAAAGRSRDLAAGTVHPGERIQHLEEEDERRNAGVLGQAFAAQLDHQRGQHQTIGLCARSKTAHRIRRVHDVGVGEQQVVWWVRNRHCGVDALLHRPQLAGPARRQGLAGHDAQAAGVRTRGAPGDLAGTIAAVIVHQQDRPVARIVLLQQRPDDLADGRGFVPRRHHHDDARPRLRCGRRGLIALGVQPEGSTGEQEIQPDRESDRGDK